VVYRELRNTGVSIGAAGHIPLPAPTMADGLTARDQRQIIEKICERRFPPEEFLRKSTTSVFVSQYDEDLKPAERDAPPRGLNFWFTAYGDLDKLTQPERLQPLLNTSRKNTKVRKLTADELKARGIEAGAGQEPQNYYHGSFYVDDRVQLSVATRTQTTRAPESLVLAGIYDPRMAKDKEYPNEWRRLLNDNGVLVPQPPPYPYQGYGYYVKVTKLAEPPGALFIEQHVVFTEPEKWFNGAKLLKSKVNLLLTSEVRSFRTELQKMMK
jgi:hypothetical protein